MKPLLRILPVLFFILSHCFAGTRETMLPVGLVPFATGISNPVCIANAGDCRLFVVNQAGYIHVIDSLGNVNPQPFLDIHERVKYGGEQGLLGVAFHSQYLANGYFYVNYTGVGDSTHISRFSVSAGNPDAADPQSEYKLMTIFQPYTNHNGGDLNFGPDGYLYIGFGDGGSGGDPGNRAQNPMEYLGKLLRIDVNQGNPYAIPSTNPFYNSTAALGEIWALGLRNPWRFSFDRLTGDLWIADVGQNAVEEIDFQPAGDPGGENYGWRCYEGNQAYNTAGCAPVSSFTFPVYTYPHGEECSVTGGYRYRGDSSSAWFGHYFFADYCSDRIWTLHQEAGAWVVENFGRFPGNNFSTFGEDAYGRLYIAGLTSGTIWRLALNVPLNLSIADTVASGQAKCYNAAGTISAGGSSAYFVVAGGGSSTMIAGQNILFNINTRVLQGGYLHGFITADNQFCSGKSPFIPVPCTTGTYSVQKDPPPSHFIIWPNPATGNVNLEQMDDSVHGKTSVVVLGMFGDALIIKEFPPGMLHSFSLAGQPPGVYIVKIITGGRVETVKLVLAR